MLSPIHMHGGQLHWTYMVNKVIPLDHSCAGDSSVDLAVQITMCTQMTFGKLCTLFQSLLGMVMPQLAEFETPFPFLFSFAACQSLHPEASGPATISLGIDMAVDLTAQTEKKKLKIGLNWEENRNILGF